MCSLLLTRCVRYDLVVLLWKCTITLQTQGEQGSQINQFLMRGLALKLRHDSTKTLLPNHRETDFMSESLRSLRSHSFHSHELLHFMTAFSERWLFLHHFNWWGNHQPRDRVGSWGLIFPDRTFQRAGEGMSAAALEQWCHWFLECYWK